MPTMSSKVRAMEFMKAMEPSRYMTAGGFYSCAGKATLFNPSEVRSFWRITYTQISACGQKVFEKIPCIWIWNRETRKRSANILRHNASPPSFHSLGKYTICIQKYIQILCAFFFLHWVTIGSILSWPLPLVWTVNDILFLFCFRLFQSIVESSQKFRWST